MDDEPPSISPHFIRVLTASLAYWQRLTEQLDDALISQIDLDWRNIYRAMDMGLSLPQTCQLASEVAWQTFFLAERRGYWAEWAELLERALAHCAAVAPRRRGDLLNRLGELYRFMHRLAAAVAIHQEAEALAQAQGDALALAEARYRLCWDYLFTRQYEEAEKCCRAAIETFTRSGVREDLLTNCYWALGSLARRRGDFTTAQEQLTQAVKMARTTQPPTFLARILNELGWAMLEAAAYDEALACFAEAIQILETTTSERDKLQIQINRGLLFFRQQHWFKAELAFRQALNSTYLHNSGEIHLQAQVAHNLANVLLEQGQLVEAETQLRYAWQLRQELQDNLPLANTTGSLAELYAKQGKRAEAITWFKEALHLLIAYPDDAFAQRLRGQFERQLQELLG